MDCEDLEFNLVNIILYMFMVIDENGCLVVDFVIVCVIKNCLVFIFNVFLLNVDGRNDVFIVYVGLGACWVQELKIFNCWGGMVYEG